MVESLSSAAGLGSLDDDFLGCSLDEGEALAAVLAAATLLLGAPEATAVLGRLEVMRDVDLRALELLGPAPAEVWLLLLGRREREAVRLGETYSGLSQCKKM